MTYFESTNSSLLGKRACWNLACPLLQLLNYLLENSICGTVGANKSFQTFMDLEPRSSLNMKQKKTSATKNSLKESGYCRLI